MPSSKGWKHRREKRTLEETPIGVVIDGLLKREKAFSRGMPIATLARSWEGVVGPRLASETAPVSLEGGILVVAATGGAWGAQARFLADEIRRQANATLGDEIVKKVQVVVRPDMPNPL